MCRKDHGWCLVYFHWGYADSVQSQRKPRICLHSLKYFAFHEKVRICGLHWSLSRHDEGWTLYVWKFSCIPFSSLLFTCKSRVTRKLVPFSMASCHHHCEKVECASSFIYDFLKVRSNTSNHNLITSWDKTIIGLIGELVQWHSKLSSSFRTHASIMQFGYLSRQSLYQL